VTGSATGGLIAEHFGWRLIFLANVPACIVTAAMLIRYFHEPAITGRPRIDYLGASLLAVCCALFMLVILKSDAAAQWYSPGSLLLLAGAAVGAVVLVLVERRAERPILPLWIWRHRLLVVSAGLSATGGGILIGVITYVPVYAHQVLHCGAFAAGAVLALFMFGWPLGASVSGRIYVRFGFRNCELTGSVIIVCGAAVFATLGRSSGLGTVGAACLVTGFGLGLITSPLIVAAQSSVTWQRRGAVTAVNTFSRAIGSSFAGAVFGAVLTASLGSTHSGGVQAISTATHRVFDGLLALSVLIAIGVLALPKDHRWRTAPAPPGEVSDICHPTNSSTLAGQAVDEPSSRRLLSD
jgi:MFS family permease